ncbi:LysR family transcriptional regulator [Priestia megaterium]|uniref:LysR family transcriptional regulator n=1 Tax=Priestia megaterium TaxID=1404 RepID=UPI0021ABD7A6|nr:LysR family transcriptional regulator [Priestia megaterium]MCR8925372.1 LysR family transcriptional regulator [Priestia megaterium]
MELRQLQYFIAVAEELNFSRAAERVKITQPPLSLQIQNLEKELDIVLFYRNKRQVKLTDAGKLFYTEVCKIFNHLERAVEDAKRTQHGEIGTIRVGFVGSATYDILPSILREFRNLYSEVEVHLFEMSTPMQLEALHEGEIDIGVLRPPVNDEIVHTEIVSTVPCVLAVPKQHPLLKIKNVSLSDLKTYPFVMLSRKTWSNLYDEILGLCNPIIQQEALEFQTVIGLVAAKLGIAVVPQSAVNLHTQDVVYLDLGDQLPVASMGIAWRQKDPSPLVQSFIQLARETCLF